MGASHGAWCGAYGAFTHWRNTVAVAAGYQLMETTPEERAQGFHGQYPMIEWSGIEERNFQGEWSRVPPDPLIVLIAHSDCDGVIRPREGRALAKRLEELLPKVPDYPYPTDRPVYPDHWRDKTRQFIDGLILAADNDEDVEFN